MTGLVDTNVVLDVLLARKPWVDASKSVWRACDEDRLSGYVPAFTLPTIFYVVRRTAGLPSAHEAVQVCLEAFEILPTSRETLELAASLPGSDFEDKLQIATAILGRLDLIVTRDSAGLSNDRVPAVTPAEAIARLKP
jgi:predicted nucleic acid-binding protein